MAGGLLIVCLINQAGLESTVPPPSILCEGVSEWDG